MPCTEQKTLFTALAFIAVLIRDNDIGAKDDANRVRHLAAAIESFCAETVGKTLPVSADEMNAETCAHFIDRLVSDNHKNRILLDDAAEILETVMQQDGFDFSTEQAAERTVSSIRNTAAA